MSPGIFSRVRPRKTGVLACQGRRASGLSEQPETAVCPDSRDDFLPVRSRLFTQSLATLLALLLPLCAALAESKLRSTLSANTASVGEQVLLEIMVTGDERVSRPEMPAVDGLDISFAGGGQRSMMSFGNNSDFHSERTFTYVIVPRREGKFTIPAVDVRVGNHALKTLPATLTVAAVEDMKEAGELAFIKISLPERTLYLGEVAPLEVRLYLDPSARWGNISMPTLNGDGFTMQPFPKPSERTVRLGGKPYALFTFSTVVTPGKAGKISIEPVSVKLAVSKVRRSQTRFGVEFQTFGPAEEMTVSTPGLELDVKPLPVIGRPKDFSGAVGKFEFSATGTPGRVKVGEPVSMRLTIRGSGNFDRIGQPPLDEPQGWTTYSAKQEFSGNEGAAIEGVKTFELPVTPTVNKTAMPVFAFSFFDPETEKYVTLKSAAAPLTVEGAPVIVAATPAPAGTGNPATPKQETKTPAVPDILANLPDIGRASTAFGPSLSPAVFFSVLAAPVPLAFAFVAWRRRRGDAKLARIAALRRERAGMISQVKNATNRAEVFDAAVKAVRIHAQLDGSGALPDDDAASLLGSRKLDAETEKSLREIFDARTELLYAGVARESDRISDTERDRVMDAIASFEKSARR